MIRKWCLVFAWFWGISVFFAGQSFACVGARPLAMGGAFVGVADDENATYWNPAGLSQIEDIKLTYTPTIYDRDTVNYDDFVSLVSPLLYEDYDLGRVGFSFVNSGYRAEISGVKIESDEKWYWFSYGKKLPIELLDVSLGLNLRNVDYLLKGTSSGITVEDEDNAFAMDVSLFCKWNRLSFGLLWQDVNEPEVTLFDVAARYVRNLRPGIAFRPDDKTILSMEMYDVLGESETANNNLRIGAERWFDLPYDGVSLAARIGGYDINADSKWDKAVTAGLGIKFTPEALAKGDIDYPLTVGIDYTCMHWFDVPADTNDFTHFLGFSVSVPFDTLVGRQQPSWFDEGKYQPAKRSPAKDSGGLQRELETTVQELDKEEKQLSQEVTTRSQYYQSVYKKMSSYVTAREISLKGSVDIFFTVREDGAVKNIEVSSVAYGLEEIVKEILADIAYLPDIPQELEASEIDFKIKVTFS